ncbi:MAG: class I SAM-dependent methyltransferase [Timaviella obliquedivisa GSE-PSE-MK23-08B]|jgi:SAM-dependent methyltransferase|nr:class I SAM-dependent methyltransferase [Timaviella obliquedivisa GSE-PSE-MK23-08B]
MVKQLLPRFGAACRPGSTDPLTLELVKCCICDVDDAEPLGVGEDFEYRTSPDTFLAVRCRRCGLVYLNPRPALTELDRIYPADYHAFEFSAERYGFVYKVRCKLEASRLLDCCRGLKKDARILDVGCGDGFHLSLLQDFGQKSWRLEGIEPNDRAVEMGRRKGLKIHQGIVQNLDLPQSSYDLAFMIATIEHVDDPTAVLRAVRALLKPGGRLVIVTDNTDTLDFQLSRTRHWGGYHFPRHWNLFNSATMAAIAQKTGLEIETLTTIISPVNWVYSIRNALVDRQAPQWLINQFSLSSTLSLGVFTLFDQVQQWMGRGALMRAVLKRSH